MPGRSIQANTASTSPKDAVTVTPDGSPQMRTACRAVGSPSRPRTPLSSWTMLSSITAR